MLLEPMMWSRIASVNGAPELTVHVDGPGPEDVVAVTEAVVIVAINDGTLMAGEAIAMVIIRLYGSDGAVATA